MTPEEIRSKVDDLIKRTDTVTKKKAGFGGQLQAKKEELAALILEIRAAGIDPKNLAAERDKAQQSLEQMAADYEKELAAVELALATYEKK